MKRRVAAAAWLWSLGCIGAGAASAADPPSVESLFGDVAKEAPEGPNFGGFVAFEPAYTTPAPAHWSRILTRAQLDATGAFSPNIKWKLSGRVDYDAVYHLTDFYPPAVAHDARLNFYARENYLDISANDWDFRLGRQQIVWGEMVALFVADVVSAKDLREFILPDFSIVRIPQWAVRAEYFKDDFHAEVVWIPVASYNDIGVPGAEFFPALPLPPPGFATIVENEQFPDRRLSHSNYGFRVSTLRSGWDVAAYYYGSMDQSPTFYRSIVTTPAPAFVYQARHERIEQGGFTLAKDFGVGVLKAETVYTHGRKYFVNDLSDPDGVVPQNTLDWVVGFDFPTPLPLPTRVNVQAFQRVYLNHDANLIASKYESGYSLYTTTELPRGWEGTVLWASSVNRSDYMLRLGVARNFQRNWRLGVGYDMFGGAPLGLFGQFGAKDRVFAQVSYTF